MGNGWTQERRERQSELIQTWKPWNKSTGPRTVQGKAKASQNANKGHDWRGIRKIAAAQRKSRQELGRLARVLREQHEYDGKRPRALE